MKTVTKVEVVRYMFDNVADNTDPLTLEVNATGLAEDAAWHFDIDTDKTPEIFDLAAIVAQDVEVGNGLHLPYRNTSREISRIDFNPVFYA